MNIKQKNLINSLKTQPLIIVIRLENNFFDSPKNKDKLFLKIKNLTKLGVKHIEIGWDPNQEWMNLIYEIKTSFENINLGTASISSAQALDTVIKLNLNYSMSPLFKKELHVKAINNNQLLIPGISSIKHLTDAIHLGYKVIKIFPAAKLGFNFLKKIKEFKKNDVFFIGAGGIKSKDITKWLEKGYNAIAIGRELPNQKIDKNLEIWLEGYKINRLQINKNL